MTETVEGSNEVRAVLSIFEKGKAELGKIIAGQTELIEQAILTFLCGGHALVEGVPGVAKTMTVKTLARFLALDFRRIQGTPDMMPADILGTSVFSLKTSEFTFHRGPVFTQFLLADEINRMPPRTQAALLESMEERQVTIDGVTSHPRQLLHRLRHPKPARIRRHLPAPRSPARPLPHQDSRRLPQCPRRAYRPRAPPRQGRIAAV